MGWGQRTSSTVQEKFELKRLGSQTTSPVMSTEELKTATMSQSTMVDPLTWKQNFRDSQRAVKLDLEKDEYRDIFSNFGETSTKARAEHLLKLIEQRKIAWYTVDEQPFHEIMGIERAQHRRMKLIMAKLDHRIEKEQLAQQRKLAKQQAKKVRFIDKDEYVGEQIKIIQKLAKFKKKYSAYARPEQLQQTYEEAEKLEKEKSLNELQKVVIQKLKRKA